MECVVSLFGFPGLRWYANHAAFTGVLIGKRELIALLNLSSWCLVMVERLFLTVPRGCLQFVIVVFPDHTHLLFLKLMSHFLPSSRARRSSFSCLLSSGN